MATVGQRLRAFGSLKYPSIGEFAVALGIAPSQLSAYMSGTRIPGNAMQARLRGLGCDINWLMTGARVKALPDEIEAAEYPVVSHIRAGNGTVREPKVKYTRTASGPAGTKYKGALYFEVHGDSMEPRWEEGDLVLVNPKIKPKNGEYGIVCWDHDDGCLKKVFYNEAQIVLMSINSTHKPIVVEKKAVWFLGRVLLTKHKE